MHALIITDRVALFHHHITEEGGSCVVVVTPSTDLFEGERVRGAVWDRFTRVER
jgi:hypothetical protein